MKKKKYIAILASGSGTNARRLIQYFRIHPEGEVALLVSNKPDAPVLGMARNEGVESRVIDREGFYQSRELLPHFRERGIDLIALAGFLWKVPDYLVEAYEGRMLNIHPALLPDFGGKGMYGMHVHRAVKAAGHDQSGMTIHLVNARYDEGQILYQASCTLSPSDTPEDIARKVQQLEHRYYPPVVAQLLPFIPNT
jgi:phosphoribosylglycinamide formyltransferase-1